MRTLPYVVVALILTGCVQVERQSEGGQGRKQYVDKQDGRVATTFQRVSYDAQHPLVSIETTMGSITLQLDAVRAPITVAAFLKHASAHKYDNTSIYRIAPGFVIQAGNLTADYRLRQEDSEDQQTIPNESGNGLSNLRGSIAMARVEGPHTATYVFYLNLADNTKLDPHPDRWGFAVFGHVVAGMDVLDRIGGAPTGKRTIQGDSDELPNAPLNPITILKVSVLQSNG